MGYIGLLLNAPYKIDSMVWMRMEMMFVMFFVFFRYLCFFIWLNKPGVKLRKRP
jgi:intracellular septation protein A